MVFEQSRLPPCVNIVSNYNGVAFNRNIRNFMIQGGDTIGTGRGGESIWGKNFSDEVNSKLLHSGRGVVSMANSGPHTNGSQFFIMYKSAPHLNFKHSVFGGVVGGLPTLSVMKKVPVDDDDRPLKIAEQESGKYETTIYAAQCCNLKRILPICTDWELSRAIELPQDMIDIEKELRKNGMKPATNTANRRAMAQIYGNEAVLTLN